MNCACNDIKVRCTLCDCVKTSTLVGRSLHSGDLELTILAGPSAAHEFVPCNAPLVFREQTFMKGQRDFKNAL